jgi:hypothetical protein
MLISKVSSSLDYVYIIMVVKIHIKLNSILYFVLLIRMLPTFIRIYLYRITSLTTQVLR